MSIVNDMNPNDKKKEIVYPFVLELIDNSSFKLNIFNGEKLLDIIKLELKITNKLIKYYESRFNKHNIDDSDDVTNITDNVVDFDCTTNILRLSKKYADYLHNKSRLINTDQIDDIECYYCNREDEELQIMLLTMYLTEDICEILLNNLKKYFEYDYNNDQIVIDKIDQLNDIVDDLILDNTNSELKVLNDALRHNIESYELKMKQNIDKEIECINAKYNNENKLSSESITDVDKIITSNIDDYVDHIEKEKLQYIANLQEQNEKITIEKIEEIKASRPKIFADNLNNFMLSYKFEFFKKECIKAINRDYFYDKIGEISRTKTFIPNKTVAVWSFSMVSCFIECPFFHGE